MGRAAPDSRRHARAARSLRTMAEVPYRATADSGSIVGSGSGDGQRARGIPNGQSSESGIRQAQAPNDGIAYGRAENGQAERAARRICRVAARVVKILMQRGRNI